MTSMTNLMWFEKWEFVSRLARIQTVLVKRGLDALLAFQPETITWATGHYTRAYTGYQVVLIPREGEPVLICRNVSRFYAENTVAIGSVEYWRDGQDRDALTLSVIRKHLGTPRALGIELNSWVLNPLRFEALVQSLTPAKLVDVGKDMANLRLIKSPAEIEYQRLAARAAEAAMEAALAAARPGANELDVAAAAASALILAGSDTPGPGVLSSGERARHLHGGYMSRRLEEGDTLQYEPTPHARHYNARFMRTIKVGRASKTEIENAEKLIAVQDKALAAVAPGVPASVPDRIYREGILATGLTDQYTNKTFYSVGLLMNPTDAEPLEATPEAEWHFAPGMTFHSYLLVDGFGMSETIVVTATGVERLTTFRRHLLESGSI
jgi:Xaa-Pro dipeptidase